MPIIKGTNGGDSLRQAEQATRSGLGGNDALKGFGGADFIDGGAGIDTVFYGDSTVGVSINLATGAASAARRKATRSSASRTCSARISMTRSSGAAPPMSFTVAKATTSSRAAAATFLDGGNGNETRGAPSGTPAPSTAVRATIRSRARAPRCPARQGRLRYRRFQPQELRHDLARGSLPYSGVWKRRMRSSSASRTSPAPAVGIPWWATAAAT